MNFAALRAISIVGASSDSRMPRRRPSMIGRMPTAGNGLFVQTVFMSFAPSGIQGVEKVRKRRGAAMNDVRAVRGERGDAPGAAFAGCGRAVDRHSKGV